MICDLLVAGIWSPPQNTKQWKRLVTLSSRTFKRLWLTSKWDLKRNAKLRNGKVTMVPQRMLMKTKWKNLFWKHLVIDVVNTYAQFYKNCSGEDANFHCCEKKGIYKLTHVCFTKLLMCDKTVMITSCHFRDSFTWFSCFWTAETWWPRALQLIEIGHVQWFIFHSECVIFIGKCFMKGQLL